MWSLVYFVVGKCELNVNWLEVGLALFYRQNTGKDHGNLFWKFNSQKSSEHLRVTLVNSQHLRAELVVRILTGMGLCQKLVGPDNKLNHLTLNRELKMAESDNTPEMIIVLGSHTNGDGSPTEMMKSRVNQAAELYTSLKQQNLNCRVIVTGYQRPEQVKDSYQFVLK